MKLRYIILLIVVLAMSCGPKKGIVTKKKRSSTNKNVVVKEEVKSSNTNSNVVKESKTPSSVEVYIDLYAEISKNKMRTHKIPASITLAQGILESGVGKGRLAVEANNHFGIKCHDWAGAKIYHDDDRSQECFRKYPKAEMSYEDHSEFLTGRKRYAGLFELKRDDYKGWAKGLRAAGYATDRKYPDKLISLIERYELYKFDDEVLNGTTTKSTRRSTTIIEGPKKTTVKKHLVTKGDTLYSLSRLYKTTVEAIKADNNLKSNDLTIGQELIISN
ncbi:glucosaminidase domain-containing protein [Winogradskyella psychrotolerans]|uniref:glucosaminidase domain-containing protein n=1 Tax=Winogradskyella psychrotolerans TaxID=1344585 RepID=UPI001C072B02|nr:glucosaminidase domain-containing protein [Winogradskyella psychrotolerans]MBU2929244.1 glucosaminidase domain-containing protein [Winogradskyella psychrotolerans]